MCKQERSSEESEEPCDTRDRDLQSVERRPRARRVEREGVGDGDSDDDVDGEGGTEYQEVVD